MAYLNLFSLVALTVTESAALSTPNQPSLNTTAFAAYTPTHLPLNTSLNTNLSELLYPEGPPSCTHDPRWLLPGDLHGARRYQDACDAALLEMENVETISPTPHTFIAGTLSGHFQEPIVETPIRYTETVHGYSCTLVVAMLYSFRPSAAVLPGAPSGPFHHAVTSNWLDVNEAAKEVLTDCLFTNNPRLGYVTLEHRNLGVFFWASESDIDQHLPPYTDLEANTSTVETE